MTPEKNRASRGRRGSRAEAGARTRAALVEAAFEEMHRHGFQGASIDRILDRLGVTRGALFHHFPSKLALGYAVVDEHIRAGIASSWILPLGDAEDPTRALVELVAAKARGIPDEQLLLGCPLNNLSQEMSSLDDGFRTRTRALFESWLESIRGALERGREQGRLAADVDSRDLALAVLALYEGGISLSKNAQGRQPLLAAADAVRQLVASKSAPRESGRAGGRRPRTPRR